MMRSTLIVLIWMPLCGALFAQAPIPPAASQSPNISANGSVVRDPMTGKTYFQQWVTESVPVTRWEYKQVTTTTYETQWVNQVIPATQTTYQPQTSYAPQPYWKGVWNPFRQPTLAYEYKPVVSWVPVTSTVNQNIPRQQVVPRQQTITVPQPVTETKTQQRLVQTEIPSANLSQVQVSQVGLPPLPPVRGYTAQQKPPILDIPLLARQPFGPRSAPPINYASNTFTNPMGQVVVNPVTPSPTSTRWSAPNAGWNTTWTAATPSFASNSSTTGLRPTNRLLQTVLPPQNYSAPMRTAAGQGGSWSSVQTGMHATVLR